jgi:pseudouridine synthase
MTKVRLNKFLSEAGVATRRHADELILAGKVKVNNEIIKELGTKIDPDKDTVFVEDKLVKLQNLVYYALYKPVGALSTAQDELGREAVVDLVPKEPPVYPVGRLDEMSEGLIILTNDGELTQELTHPSHEHEKEYEVKARAKNQELRITDKQIQEQFEQGLEIEGKKMKADFVRSTIHDSTFIIQIVLHTGYNRQIRRMCDKIGLEVARLKRTRIAKLKLADLSLKPGQYKKITKDQIL